MFAEDDARLQGNIGVIHKGSPPWDGAIARLVEKGAVAAIADLSGIPGQSMYYITLMDQSKFTIPVVEMHQSVKAGNSLEGAMIAQGGLTYVAL